MDISSKDGRATVPLAVLPGALKAQAEAWAKAKAAQDVDRAARQAKEAAAKTAAGGAIQTVVRVVHVIPEGILAEGGDGRKVLLKGHPDAENVADGEKLSFRGIPEGLFKYQTTVGTEATARIYRVVSRN